MTRRTEPTRQPRSISGVHRLLFRFFSSSLSLSLLSSFFRLFDVSFFLPFSFSSSSLLIELPVGGDRRGPRVDWPDVFLFGPSGEGRRYDGLLGFYWCTSPRSLRIGISVLRSLGEVELDDLSSTFKNFSHDMLMYLMLS